jgi:surface antigen
MRSGEETAMDKLYFERGRWARLGGVVLLLALWAGPAAAQNTLFLEDSALSAFDDADIALLMGAIDHALKARDGEVVRWENPRSGAKGSVEPGAGFERDGRACRPLQLAHGNKGRQGGGRWTYCRRPDGSWELMPR